MTQFCFKFENLLVHLATLFNGPPKPEACWNDMSINKYETLILTTVARHDLYLK